MKLFDKPLESLTEADLLTLIADKDSERKVLEYKRALPGPNDADKREFLYDASSLANTRGGDLVFGMEAQDGLPTSLVGLAINADKEILRLEQMLRDGVRPPITGVQTVSILLSNSTCALVMRIPKSWNPPHQVTFQKSFRFYARDTNGKYQIDVEELRSMFSLSGDVADRIRSFRADRAGRILSGDTPVKLLAGGILMLHVAPFSAFVPGNAFPLQAAAKSPNKFPTLADQVARRHQITFDGVLVTSNANGPPEPQRAYTQVLRAGVVEGVASSLARQDKFVILPHLEALIIRYATIFASSLSDLGTQPPIAVLVSLLKVKGMRFVYTSTPRGYLEDMPQTLFDGDQYHFVETIFERIPPSDQECARQLRGTLDHLANAAGLEASPHFDNEGQYTLRF